MFSVEFMWIIKATVFIPEMGRRDMDVFFPWKRRKHVVLHSLHWVIRLRDLFGISSLFLGLEGLLRSQQAQRRLSMQCPKGPHPLVTVYHAGCPPLLDICP